MLKLHDSVYLSNVNSNITDIHENMCENLPLFKAFTNPNGNMNNLKMSIKPSTARVYHTLSSKYSTEKQKEQAVKNISRNAFAQTWDSHWDARVEKRNRKRAARRKATRQKKDTISLSSAKPRQTMMSPFPEKPKPTREQSIILREFFENRREGVFDLDKIGSESQVLMH